jgi:hypothetical protein
MATVGLLRPGDRDKVTLDHAALALAVFRPAGDVAG